MTRGIYGTKPKDFYPNQVLPIVEYWVEGKSHKFCKAQCSCGKVFLARKYSVRTGITKSCGCRTVESVREKLTKPLTSDRYGFLTVLGFAKTGYVTCRCDCGNVKDISKYHLEQGNTVSCGCYHRKRSSEWHTSHGLADTKVHRIWQGIKYRCTADPTGHYGKRGITCDPRWMESFEAFLEDMGMPPEGDYSIDRIDPNGNYEKGNCRWATRAEQARNTRKTVRVAYLGISRPLADWADILGIKIATLYNRIIHMKWTVREAFETPVYRGRNQSSPDSPHRRVA